MPESLIKSKITAPRLHEKVVHRDRLNRLLDESITKNLIIICAPAGFGKTTVILDYLTGRKVNYAWLSIPHRGIDDATTFFEYAVNSLKTLNERFGSVTLSLMKSYLQGPKISKEMVRVLTSSLINEFINNFKEEIVFVIDDIDYIYAAKSAKWQNELFNELLDNIPMNMHLIMISRSIPDFSLTAVNAKRNLLILSEKELSFDKHETALLIREVYGYEVDAEDIELLESNLKGWITGIHLLLQAYGEDFKKTRFSGEIAAENIFEFFAHEIYENLSKELREFLLVTSLMENFDSGICNEVLGINNSKVLIENIVKKNLFIQPNRPHYSGGLTSYSYHALLKSFLIKRLHELKSPEEIRSLRVKIAEYYMTLGDSVSATDYFLEALELQKAVPLIISSFEDLYRKGKSATLWRWLSSLPGQTLNENPHLMYFLAQMHYFVNPDYVKALSYVKNALRGLRLPNDEDLIVKCQNVKAMILFRSGESKDAISELSKFSREKLKPGNKVNVLCILAEFQGMLERYEAAIKLSNEAVSTINKHSISKVNPRIYNVLATSYSSIGNLAKAQFYYEKALETADNLYTKIMIISNIAIRQFNSGNFNEAKSYLDRAYSLIGNPSPGDLLNHVLKCHGYLQLLIGDYEKAAESLREAYRISQNGNDQVRMDECIMGLFYCYYYLNDPEASLEYLKRGRINAIEYHKPFFDVCEAYLNNNWPNFLVEERLLGAYANFHSNANSVWEAESSFCLSYYYLKCNNIDSALNYAKIFLETCLARGYLGIFQNYILRLRTVFDFALSRPELRKYKGFIKQIYGGVFGRLHLEWKPNEYKEKMQQEIETLYDITMLSFGSLQFSSRGRTVPDSKWRKKKGKSILAYMMLDPEAKFNKDKLTGVFFPDANSRTADENFRQAIFNIRSVFKNPYLNILSYEGKTLSLNTDCYFKSDVVEFDINYKIACSAGKSSDEKIQACKNAIQLYRGEFLEGYYEPWCENIRNDYANKFISVSEILIDTLKVKENYSEVIEFSENLLKHDALNELAYIGLIESFTKLGRIKSARQQYSKMIRTYKKELGEKPDSKTIGIIENLLEH